ncbi:MAG: hypothetical protein JO257_05945 [Deltaproteobacteria bacterium]|nr:hypothetical protein [Deltaproteobacteria bacterium]
MIEGNRRVAAIKLIKAPDLASELGVPVPELANGVLATLEKATIIEVDDRDDARQYIGFKHINGPHKWDSFAKAKFAADWYKAESKDGVTLRDIARKLGDRHDTVLRLVQAIFVIDQAAKKGLFEVEDRYQKKPFAFSHLYTALTRTQYREYLGLPTNWRQVEPTPNPVPADKLKRLEKVLKWLYGSDSDSIPPVVTSQNPHVKQLGEVLANPQGLRKLEQTNDLAKAHAEVDTRSKKFSDNLLKAVEYAQSAQGYIEAYDGEAALVEFGERLARIGKLVHAAMLATAEEVGAKAAERTKSADTRK